MAEFKLYSRVVKQADAIYAYIFEELLDDSGRVYERRLIKTHPKYRTTDIGTVVQYLDRSRLAREQAPKKDPFAEFEY